MRPRCQISDRGRPRRRSGAAVLPLPRTGFRLIDLQREPGETSGGIVAATGARALPDVETEMVMVAAGGQERCAIARASRIEAERAAVEGIGLGEIADPQMHMPDAQAVRRMGVVADSLYWSATQSSMSSWSVAIATEPSLHFPQRRIAIGIDLDAIAFGVIKINGFRGRGDRQSRTVARDGLAALTSQRARSLRVGIRNAVS